MTLARPKQHATAAMHYKYIIAGLNKARNLAACHCGSWHKPLQCAWLVLPPGRRRSGLQIRPCPDFKSGPGSLSVHVCQLSAYSQNNILGRKRRLDGVLFNLDCWLMMGLETLSISRCLNH